MATDSDKPTLEDFESGTHLLDFYADWCQPCKQIMPIFDDLAQSKKYSDIKFWKIDIQDEDTEEIVNKFSVRGVPLILCLKDGTVVDMLVGPQATKDSIVKLIEKVQ